MNVASLQKLALALKVYPGLPHGMCQTHKDLVNAELPEFIQQAQLKKVA
jgi:hypothetical protein